MKKFVFILLLFLAVIFAGCESTEVAINLDEIEYKEISAEEFFRLKDSKLWPLSCGYKVTDVNAYVETAPLEGNAKIMRISKNGGKTINVDCTDFARNIEQNDPKWESRVNSLYGNKK